MAKTADEIRGFFLDKGFLPVTKDEYPLYRDYEKGNSLQEKSAALTVAWSLSSRNIYKIIQGWLCTVFFFEVRPPYIFIHEKKDFTHKELKPLIDELFAVSQAAGLFPFSVSCIEERFLNEFLAVEGYETKADFLENDNEYAYKREDLLNLEGTLNYRKRKVYRKFSRMEGLSLVPLSNDNFAQCVEVEKGWCSVNDCSICKSFYGCEKEALGIMADIFDEKLHSGLLAFLDGKPAGYLICQKMNDNLAYIYFGKSTVSNLYAYLIYIMFEDHITAAYANFNDDLGMESLRFFKRKFSLHEQWRRYSVFYQWAEAKNE